jgi:hypothetical protein
MTAAQTLHHHVKTKESDHFQQDLVSGLIGDTMRCAEHGLQSIDWFLVSVRARKLFEDALYKLSDISFSCGVFA